MEHLQWRLLFFKNYRFLFWYFVMKITAKLAFEIVKMSPAQVFSSKFCKIYKNLFFTEHLRTTTSGFFYSSYCFLSPGELIETSFFFYFWAWFIKAFKRDEYHELKQSSCFCMGDGIWMEFIRRNLAVFCRLISISICTKDVSTNLISVLAYGTPKRQIKSKNETWDSSHPEVLTVKIVFINIC